MKIAVLVKQVPDTYSERKLRPTTFTIDRDATDPVIDEIDQRGVEVALQLTEKHGGEVTVVTMGPERATEALRKALSMGAHQAVHVVDDTLAGSDAMQTSVALAAALQPLGADLIVTGNESTDGRMAAMPGMLAERLGLPAVTSVRALEVDGDSFTAERSIEAGFSLVSCPLPAVISVTEKIAEFRYPNFKGIMAAKTKPVSSLDVADLGLDPAAQGLASSASQPVDGEASPPRSGGEKITDDGTAGEKIAEFLAGRRLL